MDFGLLHDDGRTFRYKVRERNNWQNLGDAKTHIDEIRFDLALMDDHLMMNRGALLFQAETVCHLHRFEPVGHLFDKPSTAARRRWPGAIICAGQERLDGEFSLVTKVARALLIPETVSYTHLRAHETGRNLVCRLLLEKKKK